MYASQPKGLENYKIIKHKTMNEKDVWDIEVKTRKFHYWRGFAVAMSISAIAFIIFCHSLIAVLQ